MLGFFCYRTVHERENGAPRVMLRVFLEDDRHERRQSETTTLSQLAVRCLPTPSCVCLL